MVFEPFWGKNGLCGGGGEGVFSIKRRKRIVVSDIFLNFAFAILIGGVDDYIVSSFYIYNKV